MAAILNSAILDSDTLLSSLRFTPKHSLSTLTLTQTNSIWLKLIHSHLTWWWQPSCILPSWIQKLPSWIQTPCYLLSDSLKNTLTPLWLWLKHINLTQTHSFSLNLMMVAILYSAILNSAIVDSAIVFKTLTQTNSIWLKFIHSDSTWWWQPSCIQPFYTRNTSLIHSDSTW